MCSMCSMCSLLEIESVGHMGAQTTPRDVIIMLLGGFCVDTGGKCTKAV